MWEKGYVYGVRRLELNVGEKRVRRVRGVGLNAWERRVRDRVKCRHEKA